MYKNRDIIARLRENIPSFECVPGCHDCCGPVTTSSEEMSRLPRKTEAEHEAALGDLSCVHRLHGIHRAAADLPAIWHNTHHALPQ